MSYIPVTFNDYMPQIWNTLMAAIGNEYGVAGLMGNLYAESGCTPYACQPSRPYSTCMTYIGNVDTNVINKTGFVYHGCSSTGGVASGQGGFGLAQWTYWSRKEALYDYWQQYGGSIGNLTMQLAYLIQELQNDFPTVWAALLQANTVTDASNIVLEVYENPTDQSADVHDTRANYGIQIYSQYTGTTPIEPPTPSPSPIDPPNPEPQPPLESPPRKSMPIWMYPMFRK